MTHPNDQQLNDLVDRRLPRSQRQMLEQHLKDCAECRQRLDHLAAIVAAAHAMPRSVDPGEDFWPEIRDAIDRGKIVQLNPPREPPVPRSRTPQLAAAAAALVVLTSTITTLVLRRPADPPVEIAAPPEIPRGIATLVSTYEDATARLGRAFDERRSELPSRTVARIEENLRTIDEAIAETLEMLRNDETNELLIQLLDASYRQKVAVLELAAEAVL